MKPAPRRAHPIARRLAWAVLALSVAVAGADAVSRHRHATMVSRSTGALFLTGGTLVAIAIHDPAASMIKPAPGFSWTRLPTGYGIGSTGVPKTDMILPFVRTTRDGATGTLQWSVTTVKLAWVWGVLCVAGAIGLVLTRGRRSGLCPACRYELEGLPRGAPRCPECGGPIGIDA